MQKNIFRFSYELYKEVFQKIDELQKKSEKEQIIVAIDGMSASGKSTLGAVLQEHYNCNLFHVDDYFLLPEQRTQKRLQEVGGNVDYERFYNEILANCSNKSGLVYQKYNCQIQSFERQQQVPYRKLVIVEGAYSQHPYFGNYYDLNFFLSVSEEEQKKRILQRNGAERLERFLKEWIPMENQYFSLYQIRKKSICIDTSLN